MNKLTDTEIVKALECCNGFEGCPDECPYHSNEFEMKMDCLDEKEGIMAKALDLINRKNAENEMLKDLITYQKQEIKEKEQKYNQAVDDMFGLIETTRKEIAEAKSEAIKEFAEKLKNCFAISGDYLDIINIIDNLVKEMVGKNEN